MTVLKNAFPTVATAMSDSENNTAALAKFGKLFLFWSLDSLIKEYGVGYSSDDDAVLEFPSELSQISIPIISSTHVPCDLFEQKAS